eukprot:6085376-Pyramimonas_sp.AAC.1
MPCSYVFCVICRAPVCSATLLSVMRAPVYSVCSAVLLVILRVLSFSYVFALPSTLPCTCVCDRAPACSATLLP